MSGVIPTQDNLQMTDAGLIGKSAAGVGLSGRMDAAAVRAFIGSLTQSQIEALIAAAVAALVDSSPGTLDTLNELAAALGDDPNFAATTAAAIGAKYTLPGGGIPRTDLSASVQTSLGLADTALQPGSGGNSFSTIQPAINGTSGTAVVAESSSDTLTLDTACGVTIAGDAGSDKITINAFGVLFPPYYSVDSSVYYGFSVSSPGTAAVVSGRKYLKPIHIPKRVTITAVALPVFGTAAGTAARMGLRNMNQSTGEATTLVADFGAVDTSTSGSKTITGLSVTLDPGWYYLELIASGTPSLPVHTTANNPFKLGYTSGTVAAGIDCLYRSMTYGALPADETGVLQTRFEGTTPFFLLRF